MIQRLWRGKFVLPLVVLSIGAALSVGLGLAAHQEITRSAAQRFDAVAADVAQKVEGRFDDYTGVLIGLRALFNTSEVVTRRQFGQYVDGLNLAANYPGFQALTFAPQVAAADKAAFERQLRSETPLSPSAATRLAITPRGERAEYHPIAFVEPLADNDKVLGRDLAAMPQGQAALDHARDSGGLISSGRGIKIKGRDNDIGLAMRLPVYRPNMPLDTVEQRRAAYLGSVGAGFRVAGMLRDVVPAESHAGPRLRLLSAGQSKAEVGTRSESRLVTLGALPEDNLLFDSAATGAAAARGRADATDFYRTLSFDLGGRTWIVEVSEDANIGLAPSDRMMPWLIFCSGLAISALLAAIVHSLTTSRRRAQALARSMTSDLRTSERQLEEAQQLAKLGSWILDARTNQLQCSAEAARIFGFDADAPPSVETLMARVPLEDRERVRQHIASASLSDHRSEFEHRLSLPDGTERSVHVVVQLSEEGGKTALRGTVRDDTQRHKGALRLKLEHDIARLLVGDGNPEGVVAQALEAVCRSLGWSCGAVWSVDAEGIVRCDAAWH
ncbi:MAG TPA: CHASE domain-containing protein, partial [Albitalea sp.]|nr:CHASE domain-containing protein [Albitalea sp.]